MKKTELFVLLSFLGFSLFLLSCNLITDPERYIDNKVVPPTIGTIQFNELNAGQHVDGTLHIVLDTTGLGFDITGVGLFIDGQEYAHYQNTNYIIDLDTRRYSEGLHIVGFGFYSSKPKHGMLNLFFTPSLYLETELYFDRTPPAQIQISASQENNGLTKISWAESPNQNFLKYEILKSYDGTNWQIIKTIENKTTTSAIDSVDVVLNGIEVNYKLIHFTGSSSQESSSLNHIVGDKINYNIQVDISKRGLVANPLLNEVYFMIDRKIVSFSAIDNSFKKEILLPDIPNGPPFASFSISDDGQRIFVYKNYGRKFMVLSSNMFYVMTNITLNVPEELRMDSDEIIHVAGNKILLFGKYDKIRLIDYSQNVILDSIIAQTNADITSLTVSQDRSRLFLTIRNRNVFPITYHLQIRDLNLPGIPIISEIESNEDIFILGTTENDQKLIERSANKIRIRDFNTLNVISSISSEQNKQIYGITFNDSKIYVAQGYEIIFNGTPKTVFEINRYDLNSLNLETSQFITSIWASNIGLAGNNIYFPSSGLLDSKKIIGLSIKK